MPTFNPFAGDMEWGTNRPIDPILPQLSPLHYERAGDAQPVLDGVWRVKKVIPRVGTGVTYGHSGSGKSFFVIDLMCNIASAALWNGHLVERGLVVYLAAEGGVMFRNRLAGARAAGKFGSADPFVFIPSMIDLQAADGDLDDLIASVKHAADAEGEAPAVVVIDTISKTFGAGKENTDDMAAYVANLGRLAEAFQCFVMAVHHRPKDAESRDLRGHSSLRAGVDTVILIEGQGDDLRTATIVKQKDGEEGLQWRFALDPCVLGQDEDGEDVTTRLVRYLPVQSKGELTEIAQASNDNDIFLACLRERMRQKRAVSEKRGPTFAPTEFVQMAESKKIGKARLEQAMDRLFRVGAIERGELWKDDYRKPVFGLRETAANGAGDGASNTSRTARADTANRLERKGFSGVAEGAANGAADTVRSTRPTVSKPAEMRAANAGDTHTTPKGVMGVAPVGQVPPSDETSDGSSAASGFDDDDIPPEWRA